jgi:Reductase C-terminal
MATTCVSSTSTTPRIRARGGQEHARSGPTVCASELLLVRTVRPQPAGRRTSGDDEVIPRGDVGSVSRSALYMRDGVLKAALAVNRFRDVSAARQLIAGSIPLSPEQLRDEDVNLKVLARSAGSLPTRTHRAGA